ncbi:DUF4157 domain-containing protein [Amycolatopsis sp. NPDC004169]|uniref:eCIS core domain-containing protein n=1 Tax=Amycolatopsis sp. NPDC004169 TaxID=3154453 RepID=UPI0033AAFDE9
MWWPFRKRHGRKPAPGERRPAARHWRVLPPLRPTLDVRPPVLAPLFALPRVTGTRRLVRDLPPLRHRRIRRRPAPGAAYGRVTGVVTVRPEPLLEPAGTAGPFEPVAVATPFGPDEAAEPIEPRRPQEAIAGFSVPNRSVRVFRTDDVTPAVTPGEPAVVVPSPVRRLRARPASGPAGPLTEASAEYVAEPVEPETPFRGVTEFDRLAAQYEQLDVATAMSLLGAGPAGLGPAWPAEPAPAVPEAPAGVPSGRAPYRRPSLAESRRRGIDVASGEPDRRPVSPVDDAPAPAAATPPPAPAPDPAPATAPAGPLAAEPARPAATPAPEPAPATVGPAEGGAPVPPGGRPPEDPVRPRTVQAPLWPRPPHRRTVPAAVPPPAPPPAPGESTEAARLGVPPDSSTVDEAPDRGVFAGPPEPAGPVYRAVLADQLPPPPPEDAAVPDTVVVPVPGELVTLFTRELGVDVSAVPVHRGRAVAVRARQLGARAYAQAGQVFLPHHAGNLAEPPVRALLAHELTHAVQQRILGDTQPTPESAEGRELEAAADLVEHWVAGTGPRPPALLHRSARGRPDPGRPDPGRPPGSIVQAAEAPVAVPPGAPPAEPPADVPAGVSWSWDTGFTGEPPSGGPPPGGTVAGLAGGPVPTAAAEPVAAPETAAAVAMAFEQIADLRASVVRLGDREPRPQPVIDLQDLAGRLYRHIRTRLRAELIVDRERAGTLADPW